LKTHIFDAGIHEEAQLGDSEAHPGPDRVTRPSRARLPTPKRTPAVNSTAVTLGGRLLNASRAVIRQDAARPEGSPSPSRPF